MKLLQQRIIQNKTYSIEDIEEQLIFLGGLHVLGDPRGHLDIDEARADEHQVVGHVTILQDDLAFGVSLALEFANDFIDDIIIQLSKIVYISDHLLSEEHVLVVVVLQDLLKQLFHYVWEVLLQCFNVGLAEVGTRAIALGLNRGSALQFCQECNLAEDRSFIEVPNSLVLAVTLTEARIGLTPV